MSDRRGSRSEDRGGEADAPLAAQAPRASRARSLALSLQAFGLAGAGVAIGAGGLPSQAGVLVVLAIAITACVNQQALFSTEISLTAEASVIVCTVVLFHDDAPVLAPMAIGLVSGWLDSYHWASRAWTPMAFNSGSRALEAMLAALAAAAVTTSFGHGAPSLAAAALVAALVFTLVDFTVFSVLLVVRDGARPLAAVRDATVFAGLRSALSCYGSAVGLVGLASLPVLGAVATLPAAWIPEAVLTRRAGVPWRRLGAWAVVAVAIVGAVTVVLLVGPHLPVTSALVALGLVAGIELVDDDHRMLVAPAIGAFVVLAAGSVSSSAVAAGIVALTAVVVSWSLSARSTITRLVGAGGLTIALAVGVGVLAGAGASLAVVTAAFLFGLLAVAPHRARVIDVAWTAPLIVVGATASELRTWSSSLAALLAGGSVLVIAGLLIAWTGAPPWRSRVATRWVRLRFRGTHRWLWIGFGVAMAATAAVAGAAPRGSAAGGSAVGAASVVVLALIVEVAACVALGRVRLWRFRRARRSAEIGALASGLGVAWCAAGIAAGRPHLALALGVAASVCVFVVGWPTIALASRAELASPTRRHVDDARR